MAKILAINGGAPVRTKLFPAYRVINEAEKKAVDRVLDSGILSRYLGTWGPDFYGGPEVQAFEKEWAVYFGVKEAVAVNSCTSGLICAIGAAGIGPGDEVIVSPYTMSASATAPLWYGAVPVFADIEEEYFCLDPKLVEEKITKRTKAIIVVDIFGQPYDAATINAIAQKHKLIVIEDCAQAPGAKYQDKFAGTLGDIGVYSLNYHKHIHAGEGGVIVTNDSVLAERLRLIRNHAESIVEGKAVADLTNMVGFNFRLSEIAAAIGRVQLGKLKSLIDSRITNAEYLAKNINLPGLHFTKVRPDGTHVYYQQAILYDEKVVGVGRDRFTAALKAELPATELREAEGPLLSVGYVKPLYLLPLFQNQIAIGKDGYPFKSSHYHGQVNYVKGLCPVAERMHDQELILHEFMRPSMSREDLDDVINAFNKVYQYREELK